MGQTPGTGDDQGPSLELPSLFRRRRKAPAGARRATSKQEQPAPEPVPEPDEQPQPEPEPVPEADEQQPPAPASVPEPEKQPQPPTEAHARGSEPLPAAAPEGPAIEDAPSTEAGAPRRGVSLSVPHLPTGLAVTVTGLVVGIVGPALTAAALQGCEAVKGTDSCGGSGLFLLVAVVILMVLVGAALLKAWEVSDPGGTSFLAVGLVCVVLLVALMDELFSVWMFLVVPLISAAAFALSQWVTTRFVDTTEPGPDHDVR